MVGWRVGEHLKEAFKLGVEPLSQSYSVTGVILGTHTMIDNQMRRFLHDLS